MEQDFESSIKKIEEAIGNNKLVVFVGAGVSKNSGNPSWSELISIIKNDLKLDKEENDYLKIAQLYYNKWGEKQYYSLITSVFEKKESYPNLIHELIFELNPQHIITTNYDNLLEKQMINSNKKFHVVKKDKDIAYDKNNRMIIKMHGDLNEKNIVLKEDDYANYSRNFKLIELYIKSLLTNHTFLFLGYSLNDYNFNLIFQSIKSELNTDFQRAFFFDTNEKITDLEKNYYLNKGINIFTIEGESCSEKLLPDDKGNRLATCLSLVSRGNNNNEFPESEKELFNKISFLDELNFFDPRVLANQPFMKKKFYNSANNSIYDLENKVFSLTDNQVIKVLAKTNLKKFLGNNLDEQSIVIIEDSGSINLLKSPYELYINRDYENARDKFRTLANYYFERRNYFLALLCDFNFKQIVKIMKYRYPYSKDSKDDKLELNSSILSNKSFDSLKKDFMQIATEEEKNAILFFEEIFNFNYLFNTYYKIDQIVEKLIRIKKVYSNNGVNFSSDLASLVNSFENFRSFIGKNYICINHYSEYKNICKKYIEGLLISFSTKEIGTGFFSKIMSSSSTLEELDKDDINLLLQNFTTSELDHYFYKHSLTSLKVNKQAIEFISEYTMIELDKKNWNLFDGDKVILPLKVLMKTEVQDILPIIKLSKKISIESKVIEHIEYSLNLLYKNEIFIDDTHKIIIEEILETYLKYFVEHFIENGVESQFTNSIIILGNLLKKMELKNRFDIEKLNNFLFLILHDQKDIQHFIDLRNILLVNFFAFSESSQQQILEVLHHIEKDIENNKLEVDFKIREIFLKASMFKIYEFSDIVCKKVVCNLKNSILTASTDQAVNTYPDPIESALIEIANLYLLDKVNLEMLSYLIQDKERYIGILPELDWNIFKIKNEEVLLNIFKVYKNYDQITQLFINEEGDKEIIDNFILENFSSIGL